MEQSLHGIGVATPSEVEVRQEMRGKEHALVVSYLFSPVVQTVFILSLLVAVPFLLCYYSLPLEACVSAVTDCIQHTLTNKADESKIGEERLVEIGKYPLLDPE